jgi:hypothetical protein
MNRHSPHAVVFGSAMYGELGVPDLYIDQCFGQLTLFVGHIKLKDENGQLIGLQGTSICSRGPRVSRIPYKSRQNLFGTFCLL